MPSSNTVIFHNDMLSFDKLQDWTVLAVLKQVRAAGYHGPPSAALSAYRKELKRVLTLNLPRDGERFNFEFLRAEKAYNASKYEQRLIEFILSTTPVSKPTTSTSSSSTSSSSGDPPPAPSRPKEAASKPPKSNSPKTNTTRTPEPKGPAPKPSKQPSPTITPPPPPTSKILPGFIKKAAAQPDVPLTDPTTAAAANPPTTTAASSPAPKSKRSISLQEALSKKAHRAQRADPQAKNNTHEEAPSPTARQGEKRKRSSSPEAPAHKSCQRATNDPGEPGVIQMDLKRMRGYSSEFGGAAVDTKLFSYVRKKYKYSTMKPAHPAEVAAS